MPNLSVQCCNAGINGGGGWGIFNALFGWQNSATYGSVISYNLYWVCVIIAFLAMRYNEKKGHWPLLKRKSGIVSIGANKEGEERTPERVIPRFDKTEGEGEGVKATIKSID